MQVFPQQEVAPITAVWVWNRGAWQITADSGTQCNSCLKPLGPGTENCVLNMTHVSQA